MAVDDPTDIGGTETLSICKIHGGRLYVTFKSTSLGSTIGLVVYSGVMPNCALTCLIQFMLGFGSIWLIGRK
jgi:hypothetical protein